MIFYKQFNARGISFVHFIFTSKCIVGYIITVGLENANRNIEFKRIVICQKGKGLGRETIRLIKKLAFERFKAHGLWLDVMCKNSRALYNYKKV